MGPMPSWLLFLVSSSIWGTTWLVIKFQLGVVAPEVSVAWRFALAAALLLCWCAVRGPGLRASARDHAGFLVLGLLQFALNYVLVYRAEGHLTSGLVAVIFALLVFWNLLGARIFFGTRAPAAVVAGAVVGFLGVSLVFLPELRGANAPGVAAGIALAFAGSIVASASNLWAQRLYARGAGIVPSTAWSMLYGAIAVAGWCAARGIPFAFDPSFAYVASLAYLAVLGSVVAFVTYLTLLRRIGAGRAGYSAAVIPVLGMICSTLFEGYRWTAPALAGMALVVAGTVLVLRAEAPAGRAGRAPGEG